MLDLALDDPMQDFIKGETVTIMALAPTFATVSWTSSDETVATISESGALSAVAKGSATITATASYGEKSVSEQMTVYVHQFNCDGPNKRFTAVNQTADYSVEIDSPSGRATLNFLLYSWELSKLGGNARLEVTENGNSRTVKVTSRAITDTLFTLTCTTNLSGRTITIASWNIVVVGRGVG